MRVPAGPGRTGAGLGLMADYFISYTSSDRDWAQWIGKELEALAHTPHIHEWEIKGGDDIYAWMEARHDAADHVLCVVSDEYLKAPYSTLERNAALWQAAKNRTSFVLFVVVKPCRLPTLIDHIRRCELYGVPEDAARTRFHEFMTSRAAPQAAAFPGQVFAVSNIPIRVPTHFMGRERELAAIDAALKAPASPSPASGGAIATLHGMRGVGKTTLAAGYAELHRGDYRATWWIRAQTDAGMRADLVALGVRLGWVGADDKEEPAFAAVMERLRHEGDGILLIFDNAMDANALKPYLPRGGGSRILITSNAQAWRGIAAPVEIGIWPKTTGADYLLARTGRDSERVAAEALSEALGGLPLAHEQAAAYCERLEKSLDDYRKRFETAPARLLDDERDAPAEYHDRLTVAKTFGLAIEEAAKLHPAVEPLIVHAALLAAEPIPLFLFVEGREKFGAPLADALADEGLDDAIAALRAFALIDRETIVDERDPSIRTDTIRLHRLVRQVAAARRAGDARVLAQRALMEVVASVYPPEARNAPKTWPPARRLDGHALAMVDEDAAPLAGAEARASGLLNGLASYRHCALAAYAQARPLYERALALKEKAFGPDHPETALSLNNLALLLQDQGDLAGARPLHERALAIREKALGPGHPYTAESLNNLALLLQAQGDLAAARPLLERALAIDEQALGPDHPSTAISLNNLALLLQAEGDLAGARPLYERALAISEKVLGLEHPSTAAGLNNLAFLLKAQGDLAGARQLYERALTIDQKVLGPDHPATASDLSNLAGLLKAQGDLSGARPLYEQALAIDEKVLGPEHPDTATDLNNLAMLLHDLGDLAPARPLFQRVLAIREKVLGPDHRQTAQCLNNLADLLHDQGDLAGARPLYERALAIYQSALGPDHPNTNRGRRNLALLLLATGCPAEALGLGQAALAAHESALGSDHAWTRDSARVTADALAALGRADEATAMRARYGLEAAGG
ncbi:MAG TPA: tetratricopeptide repeat protein [Xanthobacteraceae bacterium]|jgi:tetratricopeptide (TPR) repeat protein